MTFLIINGCFPNLKKNTYFFIKTKIFRIRRLKLTNDQRLRQRLCKSYFSFPEKPLKDR